MMPERVNIVTLGVADVAKARAFYERLGWRASTASQSSITFFQGNGTVLALFGRDALAEDTGRPRRAPGTGSATLACNAPSKSEVDRIFAHALACGATGLKTPTDVFWGGYSGYFADLDGHVWEVAYNPFFPLDVNGRVRLPGEKQA